MNAQVQAVTDDLLSAGRALRTLHRDLPADAWIHQPAPGRWSAAECVAHLNLTSRALLPLFQAGLREARAMGARTAPRYRRDAIGWLVWHAMRPSGGLRTAALPAFVPSAVPSVENLLGEFDLLQEAMAACVREAEGLSIEQVTVVSPFDARVKVNLYAALTLVARHQHRHLRQAERAAAAVLASGTPCGVPASPAAPSFASPPGDFATAPLASLLPA